VKLQLMGDMMLTRWPEYYKNKFSRR